VLYIKKDTYENIIKHALESYPHEGCGVLIGTENRVLKMHHVDNLNKERAKDRYEIDPMAILRIEKDASNEGLDVVGFYHSHPDHPDRPSTFDRERAWPDYSYIIVSVYNGSETSAKAWVINTFDEPFSERKIIKED